MAKKSSSPAGPDPALLAGLRKALTGPMRFRGKKDAVFPDGIKGDPVAQMALDQGLLTTRAESIPKDKKGKKFEEVEVAELTDKGRQYILEADSPKGVLESLLPVLERMVTLAEKEAVTKTPASGSLEAALQSCVKSIEDSFAKLQKSIETALAKLEQAVAKASPAPRAPIDPGPILVSLQAALDRVGHSVPSSATAAAPQSVSPPAPAPAPPSPPPQASVSEPTSEQLRTILRQAYDHLCLFVEFRDRLVEIPRLYHEACRRLPDLSVQRFHHELESLSSERKVELHKLNEVHTAREPHLAIEKDDRLYYYVLYK